MDKINAEHQSNILNTMHDEAMRKNKERQIANLTNLRKEICEILNIDGDVASNEYISDTVRKLKTYHDILDDAVKTASKIVPHG